MCLVQSSLQMCLQQCHWKAPSAWKINAVETPPWALRLKQKHGANSMLSSSEKAADHHSSGEQATGPTTTAPTAMSRAETMPMSPTHPTLGQDGGTDMGCDSLPSYPEGSPWATAPSEPKPQHPSAIPHLLLCSFYLLWKKPHRL